MKKVLITGGAGLLGTNLAVRLSSNFDTLILTNKRKINIPLTSSMKSEIFFKKK